jgi:mannose-6-phosphate isomerase
MSNLYPLLTSPAFDPRPWGSFDLSPIYPHHKFSEKIGEAWLTGDDCKVSNGPLAGQSLAQLSTRYGSELTGTATTDPQRFPLLVKFLFPHEKLSVQVHPDDEYARRAGQPWGKTECWFVAHADPGSQVALGLKPGVTRQQLQQAIHDNQAEQLLNWIDIFPGEMIYVAGGTVHTLGPGSVLVETQQQSDTTYRLYDYGRPRELHLEAGLAAVKEKVASGKVLGSAPALVDGRKDRRSPLIAAPYFVVDRFELHEPQGFRTTDEWGKNSVQIMVVLEGCAVVKSAVAHPVTLATGDALSVPACLGEFEVSPQWTVDFLKAYVPGKRLPDPVTRI